MTGGSGRLAVWLAVLVAGALVATGCSSFTRILHGEDYRACPRFGDLCNRLEQIPQIDAVAVEDSYGLDSGKSVDITLTTAATLSVTSAYAVLDAAGRVLYDWCARACTVDWLAEDPASPAPPQKYRAGAVFAAASWGLTIDTNDTPKPSWARGGGLSCERFFEDYGVGLLHRYRTDPPSPSLLTRSWCRQREPLTPSGPTKSP